VKATSEDVVGDDLTLASRVRGGDSEAEEQFVVQYRRRVLAMTRARGCDAETASDITQETLLSVLCALRAGRLLDDTLLPRFVAGTARNLILNHYRAARVSARRPVEPAPVVPETAQELMAAEDAAFVRRGLAQLSEDDRRLLELFFDKELGTAAIAERLGTTKEAVRQRKHRALDRLRRALEHLSRQAPPRHRQIDGLR
jgi:RNA polymerase sigma factor (sigma-70 family)